MPLNFSAQPDKTKSFVENYYDHLSFFYKARYKTNTGHLVYNWIGDIGGDSESQYGSSFNILTAIPLKPMVPFTRLRMHRALHDSYDYLDEILATTIIPPLLVMASSYLFMRALVGILSSGQIYHKPYNSITSDLFNAGMGLFLAAFSLLKASLSLIVRPILTLLKGWRVDDDPRFCSGINDTKDFDIHESEGKSSEPYFFTYEDDSVQFPIQDELERDWHLEIRPQLGFRNTAP